MHYPYLYLKYFLLLILLFSNNFLLDRSSAMPKHDFYLSICEIIHKKESQSLQITFRFFADDLEKTILNYDHTRIVTDSWEKSKNSDKSLFNYLKNNFSIYDKKGLKIDYDFIGWEIDKEHCWCFVEAKYEQFGKLKVKNSLLTELFAAQKNLVYLKSGNKETSVLLDKKNKIGELILD